MKEKFLINEVAKEVHVESHVLRYWEEELSLTIERNEQGHRMYTKEDIERFIRIKKLKDQGLQLKAVKSFLENMYMDNEKTSNREIIMLDSIDAEDTTTDKLNDEEGENEMIGNSKMENPFAQKHLTKISKNVDVKQVHIKSSSEEKIKDKFSGHNVAVVDENKLSNVKKEKHELAIQIKDMSELEGRQNEQTERLQYLFQKLIKEAVSENNAAMTEVLVERITENVKNDLCKELDYQFRVIEEREEQRMTSRQEMDKKRDEEYYKKLDELLRKYNTKAVADAKGIKGVKFTKKEKADKIENKEKKQKVFFWKKDNGDVKREFRLVGNTAEVKKTNASAFN